MRCCTGLVRASVGHYSQTASGHRLASVWTHDVPSNTAHHDGICVSLLLCLCDTASCRWQPLVVLEPAVGTAALVTVTEPVPAAVTDTVQVQEVLATPLEPATADVSTATVGALVNPSAGVLAADSSEQPEDDTLVTTQAYLSPPTAQSAYASNTLGIGLSGSGFLVGQEQR